MHSAYIIGGVRTPIGSFGGSLSQVRADDLAAHVLRHLAAQFKELTRESIGDVLMGCANQAGEDNRNVARMALLLAGYPFSVPGETVNRLCASGLSAVASAARSIFSGEEQLMIAGGVEHMTRAPWVISKTSTAFGRDAQMFDSSFGWRFINPLMKQMYGIDAMGETAENLAEKFKISREDQDVFALNSQLKAARAQSSGRFAMEIQAIEIPQKKGNPLIFSEDEFIKPSTNAEVLASLKAAFRQGGTVTAGNSSGLNDGAAALLLASERGAKKLNASPMARIAGIGIAGVEPRVMGIGPVEASLKALKMAGIPLNRVDLIEINEAFAAQVLACTRNLGLDDKDTRINPNGGAIALGHPLGMSGARLALTAAIELQKQKKQFALVTMCVGVGQGYAMVLERI
ncbi:MAG: acetyl-CoA C-acyltransferase [Bacteroidota bacterium]